MRKIKVRKAILAQLPLLFTFFLDNASAEAFTCPKSYETFQKQVLELERKAEEEAEKLGSEKLVFEKGESGELITLLAPEDLPAGTPMIGFALNCWTNFYDFSKALSKKGLSSEERKAISAKLQSWKSCFQEYYPGQSLGSEIVACHESFKK